MWSDNMSNDSKSSIYFDFTANALKSEAARKQIEEQYKEKLVKEVPDMLDRRSELVPFITLEIGPYVDILHEAISTYEFGLFRATIALVGIAVERYTDTYYNSFKLEINGHDVDFTELFDNKLSQYRKLRFLKQFQIIDNTTFQKLEDIRILRNKYVHPKEKSTPKIDALEVMNKFREVLQRQFESKHTICNGEIVLKDATPPSHQPPHATHPARTS